MALLAAGAAAQIMWARVDNPAVHVQLKTTDLVVRAVSRRFHGVASGLRAACEQPH